MAEATGVLGTRHRERWLAGACLLAGALGLAGAALMTPDFAVHHHAFDGLTHGRAERLARLRVGSGLLGAALLALAIRPGWLLAVLRRGSARTGLPVERMALLAGVFGALFALNASLRAAGLVSDTAKLFPVSVVRAPELHPAGLPAALLFGGVLAAALRARPALRAAELWGVGWVLLLLGNLAQGGVEAGLLLPFTDPRGGPPPGIQYYHDAVRVMDGAAWLTAFGELQPGLLDHSRTHPPFAVLLHAWLLGPERDALGRLAFAFPLLASLAVPLLYASARELGLSHARAGALALLLAVLPAFNVYGASSLDGVVAATASLALWGWLRAHRRPVQGALAFGTGLVASNLLSFGSLFLLAAAGLLALRDAVRGRGLRAAAVLAFGAGALLATCSVLDQAAGYHHLDALRTASRLENPAGFRGLADPADYAMTRLEGVAEIALFLSLPVLACWLAPPPGRRRFDPRREADALALAACATLAAMLLAGMWKTGETARACLFVTPFLLLRLGAWPAARLATLGVAAAAQTLLMQLTANFFW